MQLISSPDLAETVALLEIAGLPTADITPALLTHFVGVLAARNLVGVIGYEAYGRIGLLRSLAVAESTRGFGLGARLVADLEALAHNNGVTDLYLLTTDAEDYFGNHGYTVIKRNDVPDIIRTTTQFSSLCPGTATVMVKTL